MPVAAPPVASAATRTSPLLLTLAEPPAPSERASAPLLALKLT
jgi:hypothetical protein